MASLTVIALLIAVTATVAAAAAPPATQYTNHTVGGPIGWVFNATTNSPATNYSAWAATQTFNLGDFLIFTGANQTVIETTNVTTYRNCSGDDSEDDDTYFYGGGSGTGGFGDSEVIPVPLTLEGPTYYFSGDGDDIQCQRGMAFAIQVNKGLGLPPTLNQPPPPPYAEPPGSDSVPPPPTTIAGSQLPGNAGLRSDPNAREGLFGLLALLLILGL